MLTSVKKAHLLKFETILFIHILGCPIDQDDNKKRRWCSTKVDSNGNHLIEKNEYGYCSNNCPIHNGISINFHLYIYELSNVLA